jgi:hypothetical protein
VERLAMVEALTVNEFMVKVLSEKAVEMLNNDLLFRKHIPDY